MSQRSDETKMGSLQTSSYHYQIRIDKIERKGDYA